MVLWCIMTVQTPSFVCNCENNFLEIVFSLAVSLAVKNFSELFYHIISCVQCFANLIECIFVYYQCRSMLSQTLIETLQNFHNHL